MYTRHAYRARGCKPPQMCTGGMCCHIVAPVRVNVAVVDVNSDAGAFGNLRVPRPRFVADATNATGAEYFHSCFFSLSRNLVHYFFEYFRYSIFAARLLFLPCVKLEFFAYISVSITKNLINVFIITR